MIAWNGTVATGHIWAIHAPTWTTAKRRWYSGVTRSSSRSCGSRHESSDDENCSHVSDVDCKNWIEDSAKLQPAFPSAVATPTVSSRRLPSVATRSDWKKNLVVTYTTRLYRGTRPARTFCAIEIAPCTVTSTSGPHSAL